MSPRSLTRLWLALPVLLGLTGSAYATDILPASSDRYEYLSRLEPYHYTARYIAAFETNSRQPFASSASDTAGPLAKKGSYDSAQEFQNLRAQVLNDYGLLKLGYVWVVAVSPNANPAQATQGYLGAMGELIGQFCNPDPKQAGSGAQDGSGRYRYGSACRGEGSHYAEITADPIGDFSVLRSLHGGGTLVSWVVGQASDLQAEGINTIRHKLPHGYYMVYADTIRNQLTGTDMKIVRVYHDGDERGYALPMPPALH